MTITLKNITGSGYVKIRTGSTLTPEQQESLDTIISWRLFEASAPSLTDYDTLLITGPTAGNLFDINNYLLTKPVEDVSTVQGIQDAVNEFLTPPYIIYDTFISNTPTTLNLHVGQNGADWANNGVSAWYDTWPALGLADLSVNSDGLSYTTSENYYQFLSSGVVTTPGAYIELEFKRLEDLTGIDWASIGLILTNDANFDIDAPVSSSSLNLEISFVENYFQVSAGTTFVDDNGELDTRTGNVYISSDFDEQNLGPNEVYKPLPALDATVKLRIEFNGSEMKVFYNDVLEKTIGIRGFSNLIDLSSSRLVGYANGSVVSAASMLNLKVDTIATVAGTPVTFDDIPSTLEPEIGNIFTVTINTTGFGSGDLYWENIGTATDAVLVSGNWPGFIGYITIEDNTGFVEIPLANDLASVGETIQLKFYRYEGGPEVITTPVMTISDGGGQ